MRWFLLISFILLPGCVATPYVWQPYGGGAINQAKLDRDTIECLGEREKARLQTTAASCVSGVMCGTQQAQALNTIMAACMAGKGWRLISQH